MHLRIAIFVDFLLRKYQLHRRWKQNQRTKLLQVIEAVTNSNISQQLLFQKPCIQFNSTQIETIFLSLDKIKHGYPLEYLIGRTTFYSSEFMLTEHVLIPRVETEDLVHLALQYIKHQQISDSVTHIIDVGTGSGCLGISVIKKLQEQQYTRATQRIPTLFLTDTSKEALSVAEQNARRLLDSSSSFVCIESDLLEYCFAPPFLEKKQSLCLIIANLPYVQDWYMRFTYNTYEPRLALDGGIQGLQCIVRFIAQCKKLCLHSIPHMHVIIECDPLQIDTLSYYICAQGALKMSVHYDSFHQPRFIAFDFASDLHTHL